MAKGGDISIHSRVIQLIFIDTYYVPDSVLGTSGFFLPLALEMAILFLGSEAGPLEQEFSGDTEAKQHLFHY